MVNLVQFGPRCILIMACLGLCLSAPVNNSESRLIEYIFKDHNKLIRPVLDSSKPINITVALSVKQIVDVDFAQQILSLHVWFKTMWTNEFISWDPKDFGGIKGLPIDQEKVWLPDITLYNSASNKHEETKLAYDYDIMLYHTGRIVWSAPAITRSECNINIRDFPFDKQECILEFSSWNYDGSMVDIVFDKPYIGLKHFNDDGGWLLYKNKAERKVTLYDCCPEPYPSVIYTLYLKRRGMFYLMNLIVPCGLISVSTILSFFLPPNTGERTTLVITVLLALSVYMMIITNQMPQSVQIPLVFKFFLALMVQQVLSLGATCCVVKCHQNDTPLPKWLDYIIHHWLARLMCMSHRAKTKNGIHKEENYSQNFDFLNEAFKAESIEFIMNGVNTRKEKQGDDILESQSQKLQENIEKCLQQQEPKSQDELNKLLVKLLSEKFRKESEKELLQDGWSFVAAVVDRLFLCLLALIATIAVLVIFLHMPEDAILQ